jgi:hypothetical protein
MQIDAFQLPTSADPGHIGEDTDENVYFSFLFIISLSDPLHPQLFHDMAGEIPSVTRSPCFPMSFLMVPHGHKRVSVVISVNKKA